MMKLVYVPCIGLKAGRALVEDSDGNRLAAAGLLEIVGRKLCVVAAWVLSVEDRHLVQFRDGARAWVTLGIPEWFPYPTEEPEVEQLEETRFTLAQKVRA